MRVMKSLRRLLPFVALLAGLLLAACGDKGPRPTPTLVLPPTYTPTVTPIPKTPTPPPPTATPQAEKPTVQPTATPTPGPTPEHPTSLNGVPYEEFIIMDPETEAHVREIYERGQKLGRDPHAFSKLGDSLIASKHFVRVFDGMDPNLGDYNLGDYAYLQDTIDYFRGSFERYGKAVRLGMNTRMVFNPKWADTKACGDGVNMLDCEIWEHNPSFMFIQLGTNDHRSLAAFRDNYERTVEYLLHQNIVPILFTKADRLADPGNANNHIIRVIAQEYHVPLIDFDRLAETLPNRGLKSDNTHLNAPNRYDYTQPETFQHGTAIHSLAALIMIDRLRTLVTETEPTPSPQPTP